MGLVMIGKVIENVQRTKEAHCVKIIQNKNKNKTKPTPRQAMTNAK